MTGPATTVEATPVTTEPVAPAAAPAAEPTLEPTPAESTPKHPLSRREVQAALRAEREKPAATPAAQEPEPEVLPAAGAADPAAPKPAEPAATPEAPKPAEEPAIVVEIPVGHPASRGVATAIPVKTEQQAQVLRTLVNGYTRRQEVEQLKRENTELRQSRTRTEASQAATQKWMQTPEYQESVETYHRIRAQEGEQAAADYWAGKQTKFQTLADQEFNERWGKEEQQETQELAVAWKQDAWANAGTLAPAVRALPQFSTWF